MTDLACWPIITLPTASMWWRQWTSASMLAPMVGKIEVTGDVYDEVMSAVDRQLIERALASAGGRIREAARRLGLARNTLKAKIIKYKIAVRD